jgi:tetratricopeptide (TPR) repeat protein
VVFDPRQQLADASELRARLRGLKPAQAEPLRRAMQLLATGERLLAGQLLLQLTQAAPDHPEVLRWSGIRHFHQGEWQAAAACLARAAAQRPDDFAVLLLLGTAQDHAGAFLHAAHSLRAAARCAQGAPQWLALSLELDRQGYVEEALAAVQQVLAATPRAPLPLLQRARCLKALGQADAAAADCRTLLARGQLVARAWFSLVDLKTVPLTADELVQLEAAAGAGKGDDEDALLLDFALGKALEDAGRTAQAFAALQRANGRARAVRPWDSTVFTRRVDAIQAAFSTPPAAGDAPQGAEVIFLVGLPRSGTTLIEQVLAAHPQVEGASELPYLRSVIDEESRRRGTEFPAWVAAASPADWARMGQRYLALSARWRGQRPVSTDKLPDNWLLAGAALAMLPQARVIDCRRDAVETCWSCYKQLFGPGQVGFTYSFDSLAAYWHEYTRLGSHWARQHPQRWRTQHYEALVADPPAQIQALLAFCDLPFDAACLSFHQAQRAIRTPSALQVRQPLQRVSSPAAAYGALLAPLRDALREQ